MSIQAVDKSASLGYANCLLDCIADLWKRVYDYACALFAYLFSAPVPEPVVLPPPIITLISDYLFMPAQHREFLYITRDAYMLRAIFKIEFKVKELAQALLCVKGVADCFDAPHLLSKIEEVFRTHYELSRPKDALQSYQYNSNNIAEGVYMYMDNPEKVFLHMSSDARSWQVLTQLGLSEEDGPEVMCSLEEIRKTPIIQALFNQTNPVPKSFLKRVNISMDQLEIRRIGRV